MSKHTLFGELTTGMVSCECRCGGIRPPKPRDADLKHIIRRVSLGRLSQGLRGLNHSPPNHGHGNHMMPHLLNAAMLPTCTVSQGRGALPILREGKHSDTLAKVFGCARHVIWASVQGRLGACIRHSPGLRIVPNTFQVTELAHISEAEDNFGLTLLHPLMAGPAVLFQTGFWWLLVGLVGGCPKFNPLKVKL